MVLVDDRGQVWANAGGKDSDNWFETEGVVSVPLTSAAFEVLMRGNPTLPEEANDTHKYVVLNGVEFRAPLAVLS